MAETIDLGDIKVEVVKKDIKNIHLSVYPPAGRVRISAPARMSLDTIRVFVIAKLGWIKQPDGSFLRDQERLKLNIEAPEGVSVVRFQVGPL